MKFKCEVRLPGCMCDVETTKERPIYICRECIEKVREKGLGPLQLLGREEVKKLVLKIMRREFQ